MNDFEKTLRNYFEEPMLQKIQKTKVGIAGAGGLGSNCACQLVRCGFRKFVIVDFDVVEYSNLNRQFFFFDQIGKAKVEALKENLLRISPTLSLQTVQTTITEQNLEELFRECNVVVEAFDRADLKKMIIEKYANSGKFLVSASGISGYGKSDELKTRKINETFYLIGDGKSEVSSKQPPLSPRVNIAAAKEADCILEYLSKK